MRITKYDIQLTEEETPMLVKESSRNYAEVDVLDNPVKISTVMKKVFCADKLAEERVWLISLNSKCKPIGFFEVFRGSSNFSIINPREIFERLLLSGATCFVLVHNHPTGDSAPSNEDKESTAKIEVLAKNMGIKMQDHIIIGRPSYSFKNGWLQEY